MVEDFVPIWHISSKKEAKALVGFQIQNRKTLYILEKVNLVE